MKQNLFYRTCILFIPLHGMNLARTMLGSALYFRNSIYSFWKQQLQLCLFLLLLGSVQLYAQSPTQSVTAIQYYFNTDPGVNISGNGAIIPVTPTANFNQSLSINIHPSLTNGIHNLYVRARDEFGRWSLAERRIFLIQNLSSTGMEDIVAYQYYFDSDPGVGIVGNGGIVNITPTANLNTTLAISVPGSLTNGLHNLYIRTKDSGGQWSLIERRMFIIQNLTSTGTEDIVAYQYYFNSDPGVGVAGNGGIVNITPTSNLNTTLAITVPGSLTDGVHNLYIRTKDSGGQWSLSERRMFILQNLSGSGNQNIVAYQYYFDTDPGIGIPGNGGVVGVTPSANLNTTLAVTVPGTLSVGIHNLYIRTQNGGGQWSLIERRMFIVNENYTISNVAALEYYFDTDPGVGNANVYPVTAGANINITANIGVPCLSNGTHYLYVRAKNTNNKWSIVFRDTLSVSSGIAASVVTPSGTINTCTGNSVTLSTTGVAGATYQWLLNNAVIPSATATSYNANASGSYTLRTTCGVSFTVSNAVIINVQPLNTYYVDADGDGFGNPADDSLACVLPIGYVINNSDCNDANAAIKPGANEICNGIDENCNGLVDDGLTFLNYYIDADSDGYGLIGDPGELSCIAIPGKVTNHTDCNDNSAAINPSVTEICNGIDDNCNGLTDEGVTTTYYQDSDGDGFGSGSNTVQACSQPLGYISVSGDCNDANSSVNPNAIEICNSVDDNCNGQVDEGVTITFYADTDGDGFGNAASTIQACSLTSGYSVNNTDCDDTDALEFPGQIWYTDADGDDYGSGTSVVSCLRPVNGFVLTELIASSGDCSDNNASIHPGATELCNGIDDNCNSQVDEGVLITFYADTDNDTYGDPSNSQQACSPPSGYVVNSQDCNDNDANQHPGQTWYIDNDGDDYGTGATVTQCLRPSNGYLSSELTATTGDCNDSNANINPVSQTLTFSGTNNFTSSLISPLNGTGYTNFSFEVVYTDATNSLPPATFPRVLLDYEGNGIFTNGNDRVVIMNPYDVNDLNTADGKRYIGTINSLASGTNWQTRIQVVNGACITQTGPFNYPDVLILPDLQIFANDVTFSNPNPPTSSPQTVTAVIHNVSDFAAQNFNVHLVNQYDNSSPADIIVSNLAPHTSTTVSWTITTPALPAWCPMQVSIDYTNVIDESNELDNSALRPFINGNFNLPGGITIVNVGASPSVAYTSTGATTTISGRALYYGTPVPMADSSVAGGTVTLTLVETGASFTANTNSQGYFSIGVPSPVAIGTYHVTGTVTDFTLTGNYSSSFSIIPPPACVPDLRTSVSLSSGFIVAGSSINGSITVYNYGCAATTVSSILDISQSGSSPVLNDVTIPPLNPGASYTTPFSNLLFSTPGNYSICGTADATNLIVESNEGNNTDCRGITVVPAMADIYPSGGPSGNIYICNASTSVIFSVSNSGGAATGAFDCEVTMLFNNTIINTVVKPISNIGAFSSTSFSLPVSYTSIGVYSFQIKCDIPLPVGVVPETNENNNTATYGNTIINCLPDLGFSTCESFDVQPFNPSFPGTVTYVATMFNSGNATANGPIDVKFQLSGGTFYNTQYSGSLAPGQSTVVSVVAPSVAPATQTLTAIADPSNLIAEWSEANSLTGSLCWDFQPVRMVYPCGTNFWEYTYLANQTTYLSVGMNSYNMYDATSVKVRFQVSGPGLSGTVTLGDAIVNNVEQTCGCPRTAALPTPFAFPQVGVYTFTMTVDPDGAFTECAENNNVMVVNVVVTGVPDMRILSQFIDPTMLNPQPGQMLSMDITYENLGVSNITDQMELRVLVDEIPLDSVYPVSGLVSGDNITISIPQTWSSNAPGTHVIRAIIDSDNQIVESNESNNQATRAVIVGEAANLYFQVFESSNPTPTLHNLININATIGNNGDLACAADVQFYYVTNSLDTILIGTIPVNVSDNNSLAISLPWSVLDPTTTLIGKIINSSTLEFTYDDNQATDVIGEMALSFTSTQSCNGGNNGTLTAVPAGGEPPYSFVWDNSFNGSVLTNVPGTYSVTVVDNTGQIITGSSTITNNPGLVYFADTDNDTYGDAVVSQVSCSGAPNGFVTNDDDCDDSNAAVNPGAIEICNGIDDDCDGLLDNNDPSLSDNILPTINCLATISVNNDANACGAIVTFVLPAFNDNCSGATISQTAGLASGSLFPVGTTTNTYVVTDFAGNTATCSFNVVVTDVQLPIISCPANIVTMNDAGECDAVVNYTVPFNDNCSGSTIAQTSGIAGGSDFPIGTTTNAFVVTDASGNTATCSFTVTVNDEEDPTLNLPSNITVNNDANACGAVVTYATSFSDNCSGSTIAQTSGIASGSICPIGTTTNTFVVTDASGNTTTNSFTVTVNDNTNPSLALPSNIIVNNDANACGAVVTYVTSFSDNCSGSTIAQTSGLASGSLCPIGTTTNTFVVTDASGNTTTNSFTVTVNDNTNPSLALPSNIIVNNDANACGAVVTYATSFSDNCSGSTIAQTTGLASGSLCPIGTTTNTFVVTDASGNTTTNSFTVTVNDNTNPSLTLPSNIIVNNDANACGAVVTYVTSFSDNCSGSTIAQTSGIASGSLCPIGTTTNTFVVTDASGNTTTNSFTVTVNDNTNPSLILPSNIIVNNDANACGAVVAYATSFSDNCSGSTISQASGLASGSNFPVGTTTNTFVVTDANGNSASGSFTVTVIDNTNPTITCPGNINVNATSVNGALVTYTAPVGNDNCSGFTTSMTAGFASGSTFPIGITTVNYVVTDASGNSATCSFTVQVNGVAPQVVCPANINVNNTNGTCGAAVSFAAIETVGIPASVITYSHVSGSIFNVGSTTVTATATNAVGSSSCTFTVTVTDAQNPSLTLPTNIIVNNDVNSCGASVAYTTSFNDNCTGASILQTAGLASGAQFPKGTTTNTFLVTDATGNTASGSFTVTVIDNTSPVINCLANINVSTSNSSGIVVNYTAPVGTDNCSGAITTLIGGLPSGAVFPVGSTTVTYQVVDAAGQSASCSFTVNVSMGGTAPQIVCPANISVNTNVGQCGANVNFVATETQGIPSSTITYSHQSGSWFGIGTTIVTATATNASGTSTCSFNVTVVDDIPPVISCPANISTAVNATACKAVVNYSLPVYSDNCSGVTLMQTSGLASGALFPIGNTTNTFVATDGAGNSVSCSFTVTVTNSKPVVTSVNSSAGPIFPVNTSTTISATWTDEASGGPYTVTFVWNDGTSNTVLSGVTGLAASAVHTYVTSAVFEPSVLVTDACGSQSVVVNGISTYQYLAVYVLGSQFTTMGGWFNTPAGSLASNPSFTGKVNMGNVVKPLNGAFKGELELNIKDQNIKVHAENPTTWDYLTITGCCLAQFRGSCKVNGVAGYKVLVAQTDHNFSCFNYGGNNKVRIKVWNTTNGLVIYDTQPGAPDNALPTLQLNGGSVQVHTQSNCNARMEAPNFDVKFYPNPAQDLLNIEVTSDKDQNIKLQMFDVTGRIVYENELQVIVGPNSNLIDVSGMMRGVYFIEINSLSGIRRTKVVLD